MSRVGIKGGGGVKEIHSDGMKRRRRQFKERKMHTRQCVKTVLMRIRGGIEP